MRLVLMETQDKEFHLGSKTMQDGGVMDKFLITNLYKESNS